MEHISLVTPNFIIATPHAPARPGLSRVSFNPREITQLRHSVIRDLLIPGCVGIRDQQIRIHPSRDTVTQVAVKTLRSYQDIHLTKIFTWRNNYFLL